MVDIDVDVYNNEFGYYYAIFYKIKKFTQNFDNNFQLEFSYKIREDVCRLFRQCQMEKINDMIECRIQEIQKQLRSSFRQKNVTIYMDFPILIDYRKLFQKNQTLVYLNVIRGRLSAVGGVFDLERESRDDNDDDDADDEDGVTNFPNLFPTRS